MTAQSRIAEASLKTIGKGVVGSLAGAGFTAVNGAAAANSGEAIVVGAAIGAVDCSSITFLT